MFSLPRFSITSSATSHSPELQPEFPTDLTDLTYKNEHLAGLGCGVYILYTPQGKQYTLKAGNHEEQLKGEILNDAIYHTRGCPVPRFRLFSELPPHLATQLRLNQKRLYRLSEFIESVPKGNQEQLEEQVGSWFVLDAFLGNVDVYTENDKNVKLDPAGILWRIDNGTTVRFRALGAKKEPSRYVTELESMKDRTLCPLGSQVYTRLSREALRQQAQAIVEQRDAIIQCVKEWDEKLHFEDGEALVQLYCDRLDDLIQKFQLPFPLLSGKFTPVHEGYTAAGTFLTCRHEGQVYFYLGQRAGHRCWGNPGGHSEASDPLLATTATREILEETEGTLFFSPLELMDLPAADLRNGITSYRMYFASTEHAPIPLNEEYSAGCWFRLEDLLEHLKNKKPNTLELRDTSGNWHQIELHPPLYQMLVQPEVRVQLEALNDQKPLPRGIQRRFAQEAPQTIRQTLAQTVLGYADLVSAAVARRLPPPEAPPAMARSGQTDTYFRAFLKDDFVSGDSEKNLDLFTKGWQNMSPHHRRVFKEALFEEKRHPHAVCSYHATMTGCLTDLQTLIRKELFFLSSHHTTTHRLCDDPFIFENVREMYQSFARQGIDNYKTLYQQVAISTNLFLFGNHTYVERRSSAKLYMENDSNRPPDLRPTLITLMLSLGAAEHHADLAMAFLKKFEGYPQGRLYQSFVDKEIIDEVCYPAHPQGRINPLEHQGRQITALSEILPILEADPETHFEYIRRLQARLYLKPSRMHDPQKVQTKVYYGSDDFPVEVYLQGLKKIVKNILFDILTSSQALLPGTFTTKPTLLEHYARYCREFGLTERKQTKPEAQMARLFQTGDIPAVRVMLEKYPSMNLRELPNPYYYRASDPRLIDAVSVVFLAERVSTEVVDFFFEMLLKKCPAAQPLVTRNQAAIEYLDYTGFLCRLALHPVEECQEIAEMLLEYLPEGMPMEEQIAIMKEVEQTLKPQRREVFETARFFVKSVFQEFPFFLILRAAREEPGLRKPVNLFSRKLLHHYLQHVGVLSKDSLPLAKKILRCIPAYLETEIRERIKKFG